MTTLEAAASLFGPDGDSGPDPFAVIGNGLTDTTPPHHAEHEQQTQNSSHPFQMGQDASSLFAEQVYPDPQQEQHDPWSLPAQDNIVGQSHLQTGALSSYDHQGYYPESAAYDPHSAYAPQPVTQTPHGNASTTYESYHPAPPSVYQPYSTNQHPAAQYAAAQTPYDPYKPTNTSSTTTGSSTYAPQQPAAIQPATIAAQQQAMYDNHKPAARSVSSPYSSAPPTISKPPLANGTPAQTTRTLTAAEFRPKMPNAYDPPLPPPKLLRTASPSLIRSYVPPQAIANHSSYVPPTNPYEVKSVAAPPRTMSPSSIRSASPAPDPYAPLKNVPAYTTSQLRGRSASNGSTMSSSGAYDAVQPPRKEYGLGFGAHIGEPSSYGSLSAQPLEQDVPVPRTTRLPYAPSPSLLGSNDPLGRTGSRAPIVSFGFGGKILTCFHGSSDLNTGFDVALSTRRTTNVTIRVLHKILPENASDTKVADFPGPLFSDPGSPVTSLVRTGSQVKTKKARVIKYLEERAEEISRGTMYISDNHERQRLDGKLTLVELLKIMVENDGSLSGSPAIDNAVRTALLPRIAGTLEEPGQDAPLSPPTFVSSMHNAYGFSSVHQASKEAPISVSTLLPSALDKIQDHLIRGERRQAYHYALDQKLWAHAMIIASSIDKEAWKDVVNEFLKVELGAQEAQRAIPHARGRDALPPQTNGREWLRVAYSVFSGQGPAAMQELVSSSLFSRTATAGLQAPAPMLSHVPTPMSPNLLSTATAAQIPAETLAHWPEIVASIVSSPLNPECSATLSALGDHLVSHQLVEAAHVCYLLSPQTSVIGGIGGPSTRIVLLGSHSNPALFRDPDSIIFSEIAEFAFSLKTPTKGQEPFHGFPHLQAYKLIRAAYLADIGHVQSATRYCEAITAAMGRPSPYFTPAMVNGLKNLADRLIGSPHMDKSSSWIGGKVNKPSLDSIGSWLEVHLTKFIAGEGNENSPSSSDPSKAQFAGPFSSYSSISSATTSASPSPPPTIVNSSSMTATHPPRRSGSAMALPSTTIHAPIDRASSAMEYYRPVRNASPAPPKTAPLHSSGYPYSPYTAQATTPSMPNVPNGYISAYGSEPSSRKTSLEITTEEVAELQNAGQDKPEQQLQETQAGDVENSQVIQDSGGWWNSLSNTDSAPTPTAASFHHVEDVRELGDGFISLMDDSSSSVTPNATTPSYRRMENSYEDEEDNLGLGNSSQKRKQEGPAKATEDNPQAAPVVSSQEPPKTAEIQDTQPAAASGGSWLSRFWKRSDTPGPIKASLGEETSFVYDKELKRWVNKKAGEQAPQAQVAPPPPSRAQTASPTVSAFRPNGMANGMAAPPQPPPPRTASAIDLTTSPTAKVPMRVRSNLVPPEAASMPSTPPPGSSGIVPPPSPMGRPRSQAAKKNVRSRYVDVFQQDGSSGV